MSILQIGRHLRGFILLIVGGTIVACNASIEQQASAIEQKTATYPTALSITVIPPTKLAPTEEDSRVVTASPSAVSFDSTPTAPVYLLEPMITSPLIEFDGWSPDSQIFAFWTFSEQQSSIDYSYPPGELNFWQADSGRICSYPYSANYLPDQGNLVTWLPSGEALVLTSDPPRMGIPCSDDFIPVNEPSATEEAGNDLSSSPNGLYLAQTTIVDNAAFLAETIIIETHSGQVVSTVQWRYPDLIGSPGLGGEWLTSDKFLIYETIDQGPLLIQVGEGVIPIVPFLFNKPAMNCGFEPCESRLVAFPATPEGTGWYHIVLFGVGEEPELPNISLYHSEKSKVEELSFKKFGGFSPNDNWLSVFNESWDPEKNNPIYQVGVRPIDPPGVKVRLLPSTDSNPFPLPWSNDETRLALTAGSEVSIFSLPDISLLGTFVTEPYETEPGIWSPDSRFLASRASLPTPGSQNALFILQSP